MTPNIIISRHHDLVQRDYDKKRVVCIDCGAVFFIGNWPLYSTCRRKLELASSGWTGEPYR